MPNIRKTSNRNFFDSVGNALNGIIVSFKESSHVRFHFLATLFVVLLSLFLNISIVEWAIVLLLIGSIIAAEMFNTAIEDIENILRDQAGVDYAFTGKGKDIGAGAVLVLSVVAVLIGYLVYFERLLALFGFALN